MSLKKACIATLAIIPVIFSCTLPLPGNKAVTSASLSTKADAVKYFECALNNPKLTEEQKTAIRTTVITQLNLIPDATWEKAKVQFEAFAKTFDCNTVSSPTPSSSTSASGSSASPAAVTSPSTSSSDVTLTSKEEYIKWLTCIYEALKIEINKNSKESPNIVLIGIEVSSELNATRFLDDKTFVQQKTRFETLISKYKKYCPDPKAAPTPVPSAAAIKVVTGVSEYSCDAEKSLKSANGASVKLNFVNNSGSTAKVYWLDSSGKRKVYDASLANKGTYSINTFITHPWVITDAKDNCLKIYVASEATANNAKINF